MSYVMYVDEFGVLHIQDEVYADFSFPSNHFNCRCSLSYDFNPADIIWWTMPIKNIRMIRRLRRMPGKSCYAQRRRDYIRVANSWSKHPF